MTVPIYQSELKNVNMITLSDECTTLPDNTEHIHLFFNTAMTVKGLDLMLNYKSNLDREE